MKRSFKPLSSDDKFSELDNFERIAFVEAVSNCHGW